MHSPFLCWPRLLALAREVIDSEVNQVMALVGLDQDMDLLNGIFLKFVN